MGGSSDNNSFIPKRGPASRPRRVRSQQLYVFTLVSYVLFFASLVASIGVFFFDRYIDQQLENEVSALNSEIDRFREADLDTVRAFNARLENMKDRVNATVSLPTILTIIENTTAQSAQVERLSIERQNDEQLAVTAVMQTDTFDSSLFQREFYEQDTQINAVSLDNLSINFAAGEASDTAPLATTVSFNAELLIPAAAVPLTLDPVDQSRETAASLDFTPAAATSSASDDEVVSNDNSV